MTISYVNGEIEAGGPPFVVTEPSGAAEGDLMLAFGNINETDGDWSVPADFTLIQQNLVTVGFDSTCFIAYKIRGSDAGSGYSFGWDGTDTSARVCLAAYRTDTAYDLIIEPTYNNSLHFLQNDGVPTDTDYNAAARPITTLTDGAMVALCYNSVGSILTGFSPPTNYSQRKAAAATSNIYLCDRVITSAGTETPGVFNHTGSGQDQRTFTIAIAEDVELGPVVKSVERVTIDWDATSEPVTQNLSKGQDETQCVPFFTKRLVSGGLPDDFRERTMKVEMIDNGGTPAVRVSAAGKNDADDHRIECYVVEFDPTITVQQVDADIADTDQTNDIGISDVGDQSYAFFLYSYQYTNATANDQANNCCVRPVWNGAATNSITLERLSSTGAIDGMLYVVSSSNRFSVQHRDITVGATEELVNDTITASQMASTFLLTHFKSNEGGDDPLDWSLVADLTSTTNVRVRRSISGAASSSANVGVQVVTALGGEWSVQRGDFTTTSNVTETTTISHVDLPRAFVKTGTHESGLNSLGTSDQISGNTVDEDGPAVYLSATNQLTWIRESVANETGNTIPWEVIQFSAGLDNAILIPTGPLR